MALRIAAFDTFENVVQQVLPRCGQQVHAVKVKKTGEPCRLNIAKKPLAGVLTLEAQPGQRRAAEQVAGQRLLAGALLALDGRDLHMRRGHLSLQQQLAPGRADAGGLRVRMHFVRHGEVHGSRLR